MTYHRKTSISAHFNAAHRYDQAARIQRECASLLAHKIYTGYALHPPQRILEFGCGTGFLTQKLHHHFPEASFCITDLAPDMLRRAQERLGSSPKLLFRTMDGEHPHHEWPDSHQPPFDLITSSLSWQWFMNRPDALERLTSLLTPGGTLCLSTLLQHSLDEWRQSCAATQTPCGIPLYPTREQLNREWPAHGTGSWHAHCMTDSVSSAREFLKGLRLIGASLPQENYVPARGLMLKRAMQWFDRHHNTVTYHIGIGFFRKHSP